jgi:hypothetical protein
MRASPLLFPAVILMSLAAFTPAPAEVAAPRPPPAMSGHVVPGAIDRATRAHWERLGLTPAAPCSDATFVRRAFLDVIGTLPTLEETRAFLADRDPGKRTALVDRLLGRDEFADYWAMKWGDLLRVKAEFPINLWPNAAQAYHRWIRTAVRDNLPYDRFVRTLLTANGSNFRVGPVNFYRATQSKDPEGLARTVALTFLGARTEQWPEIERRNLAAFFSRLGYKATGEWKEEIVFFDAASAPAGREGRMTFPDGTTAPLALDRDPREAFADWLVRAENPWFTRPIANRVWSWFLGRGVIHEPDDLRPDNPPANPALLAALEHELVAAQFDLKRLFRAILTSDTYRLASAAGGDVAAAEAAFACYPLRRLEAEVLIDALNQITGTHEKYTSAIPEPFTYIPEDQRSIALPDGSITSSFLEMFGRPGRDTGQELERNNRVTATQRLHLLNSGHIRRKLEQGPGLQSLLRTRGGQRGAVLEALYLAILSRPPTDDERSTILRYAATSGLDPRTLGHDVAWALVNSAEFLFRH